MTLETQEALHAPAAERDRYRGLERIFEASTWAVIALFGLLAYLFPEAARLSPSTPAAIAFAALYNLAWHRLLPAAWSGRSKLYIEIFAGVGLISLFITVSGGTQSLFFPFYALPILAAALAIGVSAPFIVAGVAGICVAVLTAAQLESGPTQAVSLAPVATRLSFLLLLAAYSHFLAHETVQEKGKREQMAALARENARLYREVSEARRNLEREVKERTRELLERNRQLSTLNVIADTVSRSLDLDTLFKETIRKVLEVTGMEASWLFLVDEKARELTIRAWEGISGEAVRNFDHLAFGEGFAGRVAQNGDMILVEDVSTDPRLTREMARKEGLQSGAVIPLSAKDRVVGALCVFTHRARAFSSEDVGLLHAIGSQVGVAIENAQLYRELMLQAQKLEHQVGERTQELQRKNEELERFIYTITHDLKTPVVSIQGFASVLAREAGERLTRDEAFYLERILKNTEQLGSLIKELLDLARIGQSPEAEGEADIASLLESVRAELEYSLTAANIRLVAEGPLPVVTGQPNRLRQVFVNLIDNAIKYMGPRPAPVIEVGCTDRGRYWQFYVKDNGPGIAPEHHQKIFQIFHRLEGSSGAAPAGSGVGLAIVRKIIENHGGQVWVESEGAGKGSAFRFTLPKVPARLSLPGRKATA
ncbi:MAG: GAF domain-containing sensor histidine kinase [Armatimonadetes bacterium]|nr:GAF domain-containing sensor histidine kinase [Armatimonadota bacterium]